MEKPGLHPKTNASLLVGLERRRSAGDVLELDPQHAYACRPRGGDFVYSTAEFAEMKRAISAVKECGLDGVVLGILRKDRQVDIQRTRELVELARPLPVTYHRAFDKAPDQRRALEEVIETS